MTYREELVTLIANGTQPADIYNYFAHHHIQRSGIIDLLADNGVTIPLPPSQDMISDERRRQLQELSTTD